MKLNYPIQVGILGSGCFVQRRILPIIKDIEGINVIAIQNRKICEAQQLASKYGIHNAVSSREELLNFPLVEAVLVATPNHMHEEDVMACAAFAKPTLCEKPLALSVSSIKRMMKAFQRQSIPLFVGQSLRFKLCVQKAREFVQSGRLGQLLSIRAHFSIPLPEENWRHLQIKGGGVLQDIGIHLIDLIRFISDDEIESVIAYANQDYRKNDIKAVQTVSALCRLKNQGIANFECSFTQPFSSGFEIIGSKARLVSTDSLRQTYESRESLYLIEQDDTKLYFPIRAANIYVDELKHFAEVLTGEKSSIISAIEGLQNQKVIEAIYRSIEEGRNINTE